MTDPDQPAGPPPYAAPAPRPYAAPAPPPYGAPPTYPGGEAPYGYGYGAPQAPAPGAVAPMGLRLAARIIDGLITGAVTIGLAYAFGIKVFHTSTTINADGSRTHGAAVSLYGGKYYALLAIGALVSGMYEVVLIAQRGATLGKAAAGIAVKRGREGALPGYPSSFRRWLLPALANFVFSLITLLVYVSPFFDNSGRRQGWHDKFADTYVVRAR